MSFPPHRASIAYLAGLVRDVPLMVDHASELGEPIEGDLPVLATRIVDDRQIQFALIPNRPRFRLTFTDRHPALLGHVTCLDNPEPLLYIADRNHWDWSREEGVASTIRDIARFTWHHRGRLLEEHARAE
ncbi:hypothetical protein [Glycomyces arizonensis]|uniref:hypothetical protein n=1 Tax=Glycomyces arizonensis TaxID=256035 RepID=UPI0004203230|nr:hypothetical protein [Glycomyces arizonensis]